MSTVTSVLTVVDPDRPDEDLSTDELGSRIVGMAGRLAAATCRWLLLVAEFDRREGCARFGVWSTARWLSHHCGIAHRTALDQVRVARALSGLPAVGPPRCRPDGCPTRRCARSPACRTTASTASSSDLIHIARHGSAAQLESMLRGVRTADEVDSSTDEPREYVRSAWTATQQRNLTARLDPERGALVDKAITELARREQIPVVDALVSHGRARPSPPLRDAGDTRARCAVTKWPPWSCTSPPRRPIRPIRSRPRSAERTPPARLQDGPALPQSVVERLACAGRVRTVVHDCDGTPLDVGRSHRLVTAKQFRALLERDLGCRHPGCGSRHFLHAHHVVHWMHGGATDLDNLVLLCGTHHRALHEGVFSLLPAGSGRWRFVRADGRELLAAVHPERWIDRTSPLDGEHPTAADAATTLWTGDRIRRHFAVGVIAERRVAGGRGDDPAHAPARLRPVGRDTGVTDRRPRSAERGRSSNPPPATPTGHARTSPRRC